MGALPPLPVLPSCLGTPVMDGRGSNGFGTPRWVWVCLGWGCDTGDGGQLSNCNGASSTAGVMGTTGGRG